MIRKVPWRTAGEKPFLAKMESESDRGFKGVSPLARRMNDSDEVAFVIRPHRACVSQNKAGIKHSLTLHKAR